MSLWKRILWILVSVLGLGAVAVLAMSRGEPVNALWIIVAGACAFAISYRFYSKWLATKVLVLNDERATPAIVQEDGKDFVPTNRWMAFGHHFAAIAGPGPLVGPVLAAQFGFLPGNALDSDRRHAGWRRARYDRAFRFGATAGQDAGADGEGGDRARSRCARADQRPRDHDHSDGGAGAGGRAGARQKSVGRLHHRDHDSDVALIMGLGTAQRAGQCRLDDARSDWWPWRSASGAGNSSPISRMLQSWFMRDEKWLAWALMIYGLRRFHFARLAAADAARLSEHVPQARHGGGDGDRGGGADRPTLLMPSISRFIDGTGPVFAGPVFPFVCITIACGAVSGFHSLIASGTTPKMLARESRIRDIGYGAMVMEMMVALMAMIAACVLEPGAVFRDQHQRRAGGSGGQDQRRRVSRDRSRHATARRHAGREHDVRAGRRSADFRRGHGAHVCAGLCQSDGARPLVSLRDHVRGVVHPDDARCRDARRSLSACRICSATSGDRSVTRLRWGANLLASVLLVAAWGWFLYQGVIDPLGRDQQPLAALWPRQSAALRDRALPRHDVADQDGESALRLGHARAAVLHVRGHVLRRLHQDFLAGPEGGFSQRRGGPDRVRGR